MLIFASMYHSPPMTQNKSNFYPKYWLPSGNQAAELVWFNWSSMSALLGLVDKLQLLSKPAGRRQKAFSIWTKCEFFMTFRAGTFNLLQWLLLHKYFHLWDLAAEATNCFMTQIENRLPFPSTNRDKAKDIFAAVHSDTLKANIGT